MGRVSFVQGKGSMAHNARTLPKLGRNIDKARMDENIIISPYTGLQDAYEKIFGDVVAEYNAKQKRKDRKIGSYLEKIKSSKNGEKPFYENVIQWGRKEDFEKSPELREVARTCLLEYLKGFQKRNPQLALLGAYVHMDEASPHVHLDYIPLATGYKNGMSIRNSLDKCMRQMGYGKELRDKKDNATKQWKESEREVFKQICQEHGLEVEQEKAWGRKSLSVDEYKRARKELSKDMQALEQAYFNDLDEERECIEKDIAALREQEKNLSEKVEKTIFTAKTKKLASALIRHFCPQKIVELWDMYIQEKDKSARLLCEWGLKQSMGIQPDKEEEGEVEKAKEEITRKRVREIGRSR